MKRIKILMLILTLSNTMFGQMQGNAPQISVKGQVIDIETKQPLEYATIIFTPVNGKSLNGGITDDKGNFDIPVAKGTYNISVEFISFKTKKFPNRALTVDTNLGVISLEINAEALNEVEVIAEKSTVEIRLDKKIYNVGKDMTVKGGTAADVLDNVPSVSVDVEGNVSLRGSENVRILINGKPSGLVGLSGTDALRQLPADAIEKVEVITSPSARYEAEGTAGILNIILRKGKAQGFNGSFTATTGHPDNLGASASLNYRTDKVNYFGNGGYSYRNAPGSSFSNTTYLNPIAGAPKFRNENNEIVRLNNNYNTRFGIEYFLSDKSSLTGTFLYRESNGEDLSTNITDELNASKIMTRVNERIDSSDEKDKTIEYALNYSKDFTKSGHKLTLDFQYGSSTEGNQSNLTDSDTFPTLVINNPERSLTNNESKDLLFKGDYVLPLGEKAQFEFGFKADITSLNSDYLVEDYDFTTNQYINNLNFSNALEFDQNVFAVYSQYGEKINKFSYLFGLRMETTDRNIKLVDQPDNKKDFTELFPTINFGYEFSDTENLTLGYSRRLRRPHHWFLNPFESRTSETSINKGNIYLDPMYTNSFDLGYLKRWDKITLNSSVYYQHTTNNFERIQTEENRIIDGNLTLVLIRQPINLSSQDRYGFEFTANYNPYKWWRLTNSFNFFKSVTDGFYEGISYDAENTSWFTRFDSRITLPGKIDWQTSGMYMGPSEGAQSKNKAMFGVNLAFSKDILKDNGTISLNVSDLFNTRKRESTNYSPNTISVNEFQWRKRQVLLNFTYRLNQKKKRERPQRDSEGGEEEMFKA
ncbi:TonB-dependent receptor domain-containing protein [Lutibacter sp.]|uniref:TonB-dependent receptor domain-containing protein n=1 Tax=Lutibacter sp. TaxID=1925666 RepID=UPI0027356C9F|nr:TonB-dependent receptor [Lutibacter sp.]MDP3312353.1 TonB-dependent receptor [Lutibacter sp.]